MVQSVKWDLSIGVSSPPVLVAPESPLPWVISGLLVCAAIVPLIVAKLQGKVGSSDRAIPRATFASPVVHPPQSYSIVLTQHLQERKEEEEAKEGLLG